MRRMGIDEAGRGCVLGALVIGAFVVDDVDDDTLRRAGANDSKKLSPARRIAARAALGGHGQPDLRFVTPAAIDQGNLNTLEEEAIADLIAQWRPDRVWIDALGHPRTIPATVARIVARAGFSPPGGVVCEPRADGTYPVVGAASIFAKTTRDERLDALKAGWGDFGSGYPSDPDTQTWLAAHAKTGRPWPDFVRTRWETITALGQLSAFLS